jgi:hypothetical protein
MPFNLDNWNSTKNTFKGVGRVLGKGLKFTAETLYEGYKIGSDNNNSQPIPRRLNIPRPSISRQVSRMPSVPRQKSLPSNFNVHNPYTQGRKASHNQLIDNPFPRNISEELGIPHRDRISAREYELIKKDVIRRGLH